MLVLRAVFLALLLLALGLWLWTRRLAAVATRKVPQAGKIQSVAGGRIHFTDEGPRDAPAIVMIHGLSGNLHNLTYGLSEELSGQFRVIALDRPGSGYSTRENDDLATLPAQADMIVEFLDSLGVEKPVIVGHSLGGAVALAMAMRHPEKVGALALLCPLTHFASEPPAVFRPLVIRSKTLRRLIGHTIAVPVGNLTRDKILAAVFSPEPPTEDFLTRGGGALGSRPSTFIGASADLSGVSLTMSDQVARYETALTTPGGVLFGEKDRLLSPDLHGRSMEAYGLSFEELPGRGHMIPVTAPDECAVFIRRIAKLA